jgi:hypothetical protein
MRSIPVVQRQDDRRYHDGGGNAGFAELFDCLEPLRRRQALDSMLRARTGSSVVTDSATRQLRLAIRARMSMAGAAPIWSRCLRDGRRAQELRECRA